MKTDELIAAISVDSKRPPTPGRALLRALIPGVAVAIGLFLLALGFRPDLLVQLHQPRCLFKIMLMVTLATLSGYLVLRLFRPGASVRGALLSLAIPLLLLAAGVAVELMVTPAADWHARMMGRFAMFCMKSVPFLGLAPLIATLLALRNGAPDNPVLAGAAAGLFAGAVGAAIYALHCPDDSPLFVMVWYPIGIGMLAALGAILGARLLRW